MDEQALLIRAMVGDDAETASVLARQLGYERSPEEIREWIARRSDRQIAFVACLDGDVVGWIEASVEWRLQSAPFVLIGGLVVKDGVRSQGIGRRLCQRVEEWTRGLGLDTVRVTSRSSRAQAHRFYLRDGYETLKTSLIFDKKVGRSVEEPGKENRP